jgi:hypothetical protein
MLSTQTVTLASQQQLQQQQLWLLQVLAPMHPLLRQLPQQLAALLLARELGGITCPKPLRVLPLRSCRQQAAEGISTASSSSSSSMVAVVRDTLGSHTAITGSRAGRGSAACHKVVAAGLTWLTRSQAVAVTSTALGQGPTMAHQQRQQQEEQQQQQRTGTMIMQTRASAVMVGCQPPVLLLADLQLCHQAQQGVTPHKQRPHLQQAAPTASNMALL